MAKKTAPPAATVPTNIVQNCSFINEAPTVSDQMCSAVESLANAATANAEAIRELALAMKPVSNNSVGLSIKV